MVLLEVVKVFRRRSGEGYRKTDKTRVESGLRAELSVDALAIVALRGGEFGDRSRRENHRPCESPVTQPPFCCSPPKFQTTTNERAEMELTHLTTCQIAATTTTKQQQWFRRKSKSKPEKLEPSKSRSK